MRLPSVPAALVLVVLALGAVGPATAEAQVDDEWALGTWSGMLEAGPQSLEIVYHITEAAQGTLTGSMDVPAQGATGIPLTTVDVEDRKITITFPVPGGGTYEGTVEDGGAMVTGTFTQAGQSFPMNLERSG